MPDTILFYLLAGVAIVASALVDALGPDGHAVDRMAALVERLAAATATAKRKG